MIHPYSVLKLFLKKALQATFYQHVYDKNNQSKNEKVNPNLHHVCGKCCTSCRS
jgi:hypothetical protein